jgi:hypothetical protein
MIRMVHDWGWTNHFNEANPNILDLSGYYSLQDIFHNRICVALTCIQLSDCDDERMNE